MLTALQQPGANMRGRKVGYERTGNTTREVWRPSDRGLSGKSLQHTYGVLRSALAWAVTQGDVPRNVLDANRDLRPKARRTEMHTWSAAELQRFTAAAKGDRLSALWRLAAATGMRRSELLGLRWPDVDLKAGTVSVRRARTRVGYEMVEKEPKTRAGSRRIRIDPGTVAELRRWAKAQKAERLAWGPAYTDSGYLFTAEDGTPVHAEHVANMFARLVRDAGLPRIRFHDLRHTHASLWLAEGRPVKDLQVRLGHSSAAMTLDVYGHVIAGNDQQHVEAVGAMLDGTDG
jgi:integrase